MDDLWTGPESSIETDLPEKIDDGFLPAIALEEIPRGKYVQCAVGEMDVLLCRLPDGVRAIENRCSHMGKPLKGGRMIGCLIVCPEHAAEFDINTGEAVSFPAVRPLRTFPTQVHNGMVHIKIDH